MFMSVANDKGHADVVKESFTSVANDVIGAEISMLSGMIDSMEQKLTDKGHANAVKEIRDKSNQAITALDIVYRILSMYKRKRGETEKNLTNIIL